MKVNRGNADVGKYFPHSERIGAPVELLIARMRKSSNTNGAPLIVPFELWSSEFQLETPLSREIAEKMRPAERE